MLQSRTLTINKIATENAVVKYCKLETGELFKLRRGNYNEVRYIAIYMMQKHIGGMLKDIGKHFGMSNYSSVGSMITKTKQEMVKNRNLRQRVEEVEKLLTS